MDAKPIQVDEQSNLELIYDEIRDRLAAQVEYSRFLDSKAELLLRSSSLVITIGAGLRAIVGGSALVSSKPVATISTLMFIVSAAFYVATMVLGFRAYSLHEFHRQVVPRRLQDKYLPMEPPQAKRKLMANMILAFEKNRETITSQKIPSLKWGLSCLLAETLSLTIALILSAA